MGNIIITRRGGQFRPKPKEFTVYKSGMNGNTIFSYTTGDDPWRRYASVEFQSDNILFKTLYSDDIDPNLLSSCLTSQKEYNLSDYTKIMIRSSMSGGSLQIIFGGKNVASVAVANNNTFASLDIRQIKGECIIQVAGLLRGSLYEIKLVRE